MNIELLEKVKQQILSEPSQFNMMFFSCDGVRCILGWANELYDIVDDIMLGKVDSSQVEKYKAGGIVIQACYALDIHLDQCYKIGVVERWPDTFKYAYKNVDGHIEVLQRLRAKIAAERIDHFIATEGRE